MPVHRTTPYRVGDTVTIRSEKGGTEVRVTNPNGVVKTKVPGRDGTVRLELVRPGRWAWDWNTGEQGTVVALSRYVTGDARPGVPAGLIRFPRG